MFKSKTVFIVCAGASHEAGMPTGDRLTGAISEILRCEGEGVRRHVANPHIQKAIETANLREQRRVVGFVAADQQSSQRP